MLKKIILNKIFLNEENKEKEDWYFPNFSSKALELYKKIVLCYFMRLRTTYIFLYLV